MKKISSNLSSITKILSDLNYHDGNNIGNKLGITRSAVWKNIKKLENYGIEIDSLKTRGYILKDPLILLDEEKIKSEIDDQYINLEIFETLGSTNDYIKASKAKEKINICIAEHLSNARGRMGRKWHAPFGQNIYLSYGYYFKKDLAALSGLSLIISLALIKACNILNLKEKLSVKWPNDLVYQGRKIAGILIEILAEANGSSYVIIGIGLNVNMKSDQNEDITQDWTSLVNLKGRYIDRNELSVSIINELSKYLYKFNQVGLEGFTEEWMGVDALFNQKIKILSGDLEIQGIAKSINNYGNLIVQLENGELKTYSSGDATILKK
jgi:BirA family biotin operon repressor/biotin-[acetyl-CoA-carboxylase] ligase